MAPSRAQHISSSTPSRLAPTGSRGFGRRCASCRGQGAVGVPAVSRSIYRTPPRFSPMRERTIAMTIRTMSSDTIARRQPGRGLGSSSGGPEPRSRSASAPACASGDPGAVLTPPPPVLPHVIASRGRVVDAEIRPAGEPRTDHVALDLEVEAEALGAKAIRAEAVPAAGHRDERLLVLDTVAAAEREDRPQDAGAILDAEDRLPRIVT